MPVSGQGLAGDDAKGLFRAFGTPEGQGFGGCAYEEEFGFGDFES